MTHEPNRDEAAFWNEEAGPKWVRHQAAFDALFSGVLDRLIRLAAPAPGACVVDIGCGAGTSTFALAAAVGPTGRVTGLDISRPLLARAKEQRAVGGSAPAAFLLADAQTHPFEPGAADIVVSRFGVMFFDDPVAAFANLRAAARSGGRLAFAAWGPISGNPWFAQPRDAAIARLGAPAPKDPHAPGPFAFADAARVLGILADAGWSGGAVSTEEVILEMPGTAAQVAAFAVNLGPAVRLVIEKGGDEADTAAIAGDVAGRFVAYAVPGAVRVPGLIHFFTARAA